jgi:hypothetical protein
MGFNSTIAYNLHTMISCGKIAQERMKSIDDKVEMGNVIEWLTQLYNKVGEGKIEQEDYKHCATCGNVVWCGEIKEVCLNTGLKYWKRGNLC